MKLVSIFLLVTIGICGYSGKSLSGALIALSFPVSIVTQLILAYQQ
jgi:hypothetical protein